MPLSSGPRAHTTTKGLALERQKVETIELQDGSFLQIGEEFSVTGEGGEYVFKGVTPMVVDGEVKETWVDAYGGTKSPKGVFRKWRAFHPERLQVPRKGPRGGDITVGVAGYETRSPIPDTPVWEPTDEEIAAARKVKAERKAKRRSEVGGRPRASVESGALPAGTVLTHGDATCTVAADGTVVFADVAYDSLSAAGRALTGHKGCQGWKFWFLPDGRPVDAIRS